MYAASAAPGLPRSTDVFVIGGGPAGLAAAIAARNCGFDVTVADGATPPIDKACGEGIMPDGLGAARALGMELEDGHGAAFRGIRLCEGAASVESAFANGHGIGLRRTALHGLLVERAAAAGVRLAWGVPVSGIDEAGVSAGGRLVRARWIVGADGGQSRVRRWTGLEAGARASRRYGFRRHYRMTPWTDFVELHWSDGCQLYITPLAAGEICVVLMSRHPHLRLEEALPRFPAVARRIGSACPVGIERGGVSASLRLRSVCRGNVALVGDAAGSVDAITGEGLCLLFQQAGALARALEASDLDLYRREHRRIGRRPEFVADLMLLLAERGRLRRRALRAMASRPHLFASMLAMHVGGLPPLDYLTSGLALGCRMLTV